MSEIDALQLNFNPAAQDALKWILALIMFGVALDMRMADFTRIVKSPKAPAIGLSCQFLLMPGLAWLLVTVMGVSPSLALGMILVAACPGGNLSNFLTGLSGGNSAVSVSMSAISTLAAIFMTPFNLAFGGSLQPETAELLRAINIEPLGVLEKVVVILVIPTALGMWFAAKFPAVGERLKPFMRWGSMVVFLSFVFGAFAANWENFLNLIGAVFVLVLIVNAAGYSLGYFAARLLRQPKADAKAVSFETGIQNTGFGLILALEFFQGLGGVALVCAWWGTWHILSGLVLAWWWRLRSRETVL